MVARRTRKGPTLVERKRGLIELQNLTCPIDQTTLVESKTSGEISSKCSECEGVWLTFDALVSLEDRAASEDMVKGQRQYGKHAVDHLCPHCGEQMTRFRYRGYNLEIEACPSDAGFWLDKSEDREIRDVMKRRTANLSRSASAERSWRQAKRGTRPGVFQRIKEMLGFR
ncbi:MAG: zf-TFIIB domain-containing protein [Chloroflexi bacterium]|nr:zf-TFIIB domain-containing protein [Chloroflexota bacterium]